MPPIRVLQIMTDISPGGGVAQVVLNWHRNINRSLVQFDYLYCQDTKQTFATDIEALGGHVYKLPYPSMVNPFVFIGALARFFKEHKYTIIHSHVTHLSFFYVPMARFYGIKNIVHHAHGAQWSDKFLNGLRNRLMLGVVKPLIKRRLACSALAGRVFYGNNFTVISNAIDTAKFDFNPALRQTIRGGLNIQQDAFVIGHSGRLAPEKNHLFLLDVFAEVYRKNSKAILLIAGDGAMGPQIKAKAAALGIEGAVNMLGVYKDIAALYQAMDCFVFPSLHEGFGLSAIEAQCAGLPCVISSTIPSEVAVINATVLPLDFGPQKWAQKVFDITVNYKRASSVKAVCDMGFDIKQAADKLEDFYLKLAQGA